MRAIIILYMLLLVVMWIPNYQLRKEYNRIKNTPVSKDTLNLKAMKLSAESDSIYKSDPVNGTERLREINQELIDLNSRK